IAGINATVLSILGAVAAVYAGRIFEKLDEFQAAVLISANRINALPSPGGSLGGPIFEKYLSPQETRSPEEVADEIAERALKMMMGLLGDWPDEPAHRGEQLSQTLTLVVMRYPFPTVIEVQPQGEIAMLAVPRPVSLRTGKQVRDWVGTLRSITARLLWAWEGNQGKVKAMFSGIGGTQHDFMRPPAQQPAR